MTDPLGDFWVHACQVERYTGSTAYGDSYAAPVTVSGLVDDREKLVAGAGGQSVTASSSVFFPIGTADIPAKSRVTLPAAFGSRRSQVIGFARRDGGGLPLPAHLEVNLQ